MFAAYQSWKLWLRKHSDLQNIGSTNRMKYADRYIAVVVVALQLVMLDRGCGREAW